jgi:hypothetical protein
LPKFVVPEAGPAASLIRGNQKFRDKLDRLSGTILIALGAYVLLAKSDQKVQQLK